MSEFVLTPAERALLQGLDAIGVRYLIVGMGAALLEGAAGTTQDLEMWFEFNMQPPAIGGEGLDRVDIVLTASGLGSFQEEYARAKEYDLEGLRVRVLPLARVIASKRAANRPKDTAQLPFLEAALAAREETEPGG